MFNKYFKNQNGMVLPLVLLVFVVLIILGVTVLNISSADNRHSIYQDNKLQAHYLAKSGAQTMATYLIDKSYSMAFIDMNELIADISDKTSEVINFDSGNFVIETVKRSVDGQEKLDIISKGNYRGVTDTVTVTLLVSIQSKDEDYNPTSEENALVTLSEDANLVLELTGSGYIDGDVIINATKENSVWFGSTGGYWIRNGSLWLPNGTNPHYVIKSHKGANYSELPSEYENPNLGTGWISNWAFWKDIDTKPNGVKFTSIPTYPSSAYPEPVFPLFPSNSVLNEADSPDFTTPWKEGLYYPITEDGYYNSIQPSSSRTITVDLAGGNRVIRVGTLNLTGGNIELINAVENSKLILYVENSFSIGSDRSLNGNGIPNNVHIYYGGSQKVTINGASRFSGNIFVEKADIDFTAGANMKGTITTLGTYVKVSGGSTADDIIIYAPNGLVERAGSGLVNGSVIAKKYKASGGGTSIKYTPSQYSIPGDFFSGTSETISIEYDQNPWR